MTTHAQFVRYQDDWYYVGLITRGPNFVKHLTERMEEAKEEYNLPRVDEVSLIPQSDKIIN